MPDPLSNPNKPKPTQRLLSREEFDALIAKAPPGMTREQFDAYIDQQSERLAQEVEDADRLQPTQAKFLERGAIGVTKGIAGMIPGLISAVTDTDEFARNTVEGIHERISGLVGDVHPSAAMTQLREGRPLAALGNLLPVGEIYRDPGGIAMDTVGVVEGLKAGKAAVNRVRAAVASRRPPSGGGGGGTSTTGTTAPPTIPPAGPMTVSVEPKSQVRGFGRSEMPVHGQAEFTPAGEVAEGKYNATAPTTTLRNPDDVLYDEMLTRLGDGAKVEGVVEAGSPIHTTTFRGEKGAFSKPTHRLTISERLKDETGAVGPGADDLMRRRAHSAAEPVGTGEGRLAGSEDVGGGSLIPGPASMPELPGSAPMQGWQDAITPKTLDILKGIFQRINNEKGAIRIPDSLREGIQRGIGNERGGVFEVEGRRRPMPTDDQITPIDDEVGAVGPGADAEIQAYRDIPTVEQLESVVPVRGPANISDRMWQEINFGNPTSDLSDRAAGLYRSGAGNVNQVRAMDKLIGLVDKDPSMIRSQTMTFDPDGLGNLHPRAPLDPGHGQPGHYNPEHTPGGAIASMRARGLFDTFKNEVGAIGPGTDKLVKAQRAQDIRNRINDMSQEYYRPYDEATPGNVPPDASRVSDFRNGPEAFEQVRQQGTGTGPHHLRMVPERTWHSPQADVEGPWVEKLKPELENLNEMERLERETGGQMDPPQIITGGGKTTVIGGNHRMHAAMDTNTPLEMVMEDLTDPDAYSSRLRSSRMGITDKDWESGAREGPRGDVDRAQAHRLHRDLADMDKRFKFLIDDESGMVPADLPITMMRIVAQQLFREAVRDTIHHQVGHPIRSVGRGIGKGFRFGAKATPTLQLGAPEEDR